MKTLIVYAHPDHNGNCGAILSEVEKQLKQRKEKYELLDLYAINYDPVLHDDELYSHGKRKVSAVNKKIQAKISATNKLIFIYPIWWGTMPAILKGFVDKVFTPYFAFRFVKVPIINGYPIKMLKGKKAACFVTTSSKWFITLLYSSNAFKQLIARDMLGFFGIKTRVYQIDNAIALNDSQARKIKHVVTKGLERLYS